MSKAIEQVKALPIQKVELMSVDLIQYSEKSQELIEQAERAVIENEDHYAAGGDLIKIANTLSKKVDDHRKKLSGPFHLMWKFINGQFNDTKSEFDKVRKTIEPKMLAWKKEEDKKLRIEAEAAAKKLEEEALERAELEQTDEGQDEVLEAAAEASKDMVEDSGLGIQRGNYGSSTSTTTKYSTRVNSQIDFLRALVKHIDDGNARNIDVGSIVELRKGGLNTLAKNMIKAGVKKMPGAEFKAEDSLRIS